MFKPAIDALVPGLIASTLLAGAAHAAPMVVAPGYSLSVFAPAPAGASGPDSIAVVGNNVFIGYGDGGKPDGSGGAMSTIAEYTGGGVLEGTITVVGHNDGLRYNASTGQLWAVQNEDGNPNLVLIDPSTRAASAPLAFSSTPHGGGYDDVAFGAGGAYVSASNPAGNPNTAPAIVSVALAGGGVQVLGGVLNGNASATVLNPGGGVVTLNLQDPDSLIFAPDGRLVLDSQSDQQLVFITGVGSTTQSAGVLNLSSSVDDTIFGTGGLQRLLVADTPSNTVYAVTGKFGAVSAADSLGQVASLNLADGQLTALVGGFGAPHGLAFAPGVPEPATWAMMLIGLGGIGVAMRLRRRQVAAVA